MAYYRGHNLKIAKWKGCGRTASVATAFSHPLHLCHSLYILHLHMFVHRLRSFPNTLLWELPAILFPYRRLSKRPDRRYKRWLGRLVVLLPHRPAAKCYKWNCLWFLNDKSFIFHILCVDLIITLLPTILKLSLHWWATYWPLRLYIRDHPSPNLSTKPGLLQFNINWLLNQPLWQQQGLKCFYLFVLFFMSILHTCM